MIIPSDELEDALDEAFENKFVGKINDEYHLTFSTMIDIRSHLNLVVIASERDHVFKSRKNGLFLTNNIKKTYFEKPTKNIPGYSNCLLFKPDMKSIIQLLRPIKILTNNKENSITFYCQEIQCKEILNMLGKHETLFFNANIKIHWGENNTTSFEEIAYVAQIDFIFEETDNGLF